MKQPGLSRLLHSDRAYYERYHHVGLPNLQAAKLYNNQKQKNRAAQTGAQEILPLL
jgi:hypothetical protein